MSTGAGERLDESARGTHRRVRCGDKRAGGWKESCGRDTRAVDEQTQEEMDEMFSRCS